MSSNIRDERRLADGDAGCRPHMRFVPIKDEHQQAVLTMHRARQGFVKERT